MLRIAPGRETRDLKLRGGSVVVTVDHADFVTRQAARFKAAEKIKQLRDGGEVLEEFGYSSEHHDALADKYIMMGFAELIFAVELGVLIIRSWSGVVDPQDNPIEVTRAAIVAVMRQAASDFISAETEAADKVTLEGNAFTSVPSGIGAGAQSTAKAVSPKEPTVQKDVGA